MYDSDGRVQWEHGHDDKVPPLVFKESLFLSIVQVSVRLNSLSLSPHFLLVVCGLKFQWLELGAVKTDLEVFPTRYFDFVFLENFCSVENRWAQ